MNDPRSPAERFQDVELMARAFRKAVRIALLQHKRAGNPICVWQDGAVVWIPADQIPVEEGED
jgi:hypothetical protein